MGKNKEEQTKIEFRGIFGVDGVAGGDVYPHWEVDVETYKKIQKQVKGVE